MRILFFIIAVLFLSACHTSRQAKGDYSKNKSRTKNEVVSKSRNKPSKKDKRTASAAASHSDEEYLNAISSKSTPASNEESKVVSSSDKSPALHDDSNYLTYDLINEADKLIGVTYRYGGTSPARGFDCSGFTSYVFDKLNIEIPRTSTDQSKAGDRKKFRDASIGDLVFFGTGSRVTHVGIVVARSANTLEVIHSTSSSGVRRDEIFGSKYWNSRTLWAIDFESLNSK